MKKPRVDYEVSTVTLSVFSGETQGTDSLSQEKRYSKSTFPLCIQNACPVLPKSGDFKRSFPTSHIHHYRLNRSLNSC